MNGIIKFSNHVVDVGCNFWASSETLRSHHKTSQAADTLEHLENHEQNFGMLLCCDAFTLVFSALHILDWQLFPHCMLPLRPMWRII